MIQAAALALIVLHAVDGSEIIVNAQAVTSLREAADDNKHFTGEVHCMVSLQDGKFVAVVEDCAMVRNRIKQVQ